MGQIIGNQLYFLHIPKTGGAWVARVLGGRSVDGEHTPVPGPYAEDRTVFTTVREPADWLMSVWGHVHRAGHRAAPPGTQMGPMVKNLLDRIHTRGIGLQEFLENYYQGESGAVAQIFEQYTRNADRILHTETLRRDLIEFLEDIDDLSPERRTKIMTEPKFNAMNRDCLYRKDMVDDELIDAINNMERP